ncbi:MAG: CsbD family protein [Oceanicaulis sp.]
MHADQLKGKWNQLQGDAKRQWGKLTDDDLKTVEGDSQKLSGKIQERYGKSKDEADREVNDWMDKQDDDRRRE